MPTVRNFSAGIVYKVHDELYITVVLPNGIRQKIPRGRCKVLKNEKEYFKFLGVDIGKEEAKALEKSAKVTSHEDPVRVDAIMKLGGGNDTSGQGNERYGGFGLPRELKG